MGIANYTKHNVSVTHNELTYIYFIISKLVSGMANWHNKTCSVSLDNKGKTEHDGLEDLVSMR